MQEGQARKREGSIFISPALPWVWSHFDGLKAGLQHEGRSKISGLLQATISKMEERLLSSDVRAFHLAPSRSGPIDQ